MGVSAALRRDEKGEPCVLWGPAYCGRRRCDGVDQWRDNRICAAAQSRTIVIVDIGEACSISFASQFVVIVLMNI
jgi:hypothetical protein